MIESPELVRVVLIRDVVAIVGRSAPVLGVASYTTNAPSSSEDRCFLPNAMELRSQTTLDSDVLAHNPDHPGDKLSVRSH